MGCWHFGLRKKLLPYLEGTLAANEVKQLEEHLLGCDACRSLTVRLRAGHRIALQLAGLELENTSAPDFDVVVQAAHCGAHASTVRTAWQGWLLRFATPRAVTTLALLVAVQLVLLVASNRGLLFGKRAASVFQPSALDLADFRPVNLDQLKSNTQPHVVIEGYVKDVHTDEEEGTVAFRVFANPRARAPFVVCEIMSPISLTPPRDGSHVRVYGVSRYDAQTDRDWYELNPVLKIKKLDE
jgi:Putative zinc-finger